MWVPKLLSKRNVRTVSVSPDPPVQRDDQAGGNKTEKKKPVLLRHQYMLNKSIIFLQISIHERPYVQMTNYLRNDTRLNMLNKSIICLQISIHKRPYVQMTNFLRNNTTPNDIDIF